MAAFAGAATVSAMSTPLLPPAGRAFEIAAMPAPTPSAHSC